MRWLAPERFDAGGGLPAWAPLAYDGAARALVRGLKFHGAVRLADVMAAQIAANAPPALLPADAALVPVPLAAARRRKRGFNQAEQLSRALARRVGLPVVDCLERAGPAGASQVGRDRQERISALAGAVRLRMSACAPTRAVLVDDVVTTGATLAACAAALRNAGAAEIGAVAYARTGGR